MEIAFLRIPRVDELDSTPKWKKTTSKISEVITELQAIPNERLVGITEFSIKTINAQAYLNVRTL